MPQRINRLQRGGPHGGIDAEEHADECAEEIVRHIRVAIQYNQRDTGLFHLGEDGIPAALDNWRDADNIDALRDERADGLDLIFLPLLRIGEL